MSEFAKSRTRYSLLCRAAAVALAVGTFGNITAAFADDDPIETIVVTGTRFNTNAAPAKASVDTVEPQTVINRSYIENFVPPQADYVTILAIVPSMTGGDPNGPGLSDGGEKNSLRGIGDGNYTIQFDGIPFGDTNGPTHHNISYFQSFMVGSIVVDRGPGNAGNMGASTYGGTVKIFSQSLATDPQGSVWGSYGSFSTQSVTLFGQSGNLEALGTTTRVLAGIQGVESNGALSQQDLRTWTSVLKTETDITDDWRLTLFSTYTHITEHLDDNNGLTPAQIQFFGKNFSLQNTDPNLPTYYAYNWTTKATDMEHLHLTGTIIDNVKVDNTGYTYAYWNHTFSPASQLQTTSQILADTSSDNGTVTLLNGKTIPNQLTSYTKENRYRVWGDIFRLSEDYDLGWISGQVREGAWVEHQATHRFRFYFDPALCNADGVNPYIAGDGAAASACGINPNVTTPSSAQVKTVSEGGLGYTAYDEFTTWTQYQPFVEVDLKPIDDLTITPGFKYVHWIHGTDSPTETKSLCGVATKCLPFNNVNQFFSESFITRRALPFLTVNYKLTPSWSVYGEYAQGIYVPDITAFENKAVTIAFPAPELTTNYQLGTVFYSDNFTFDTDIYYIEITNNYVSQACAPPNQTDNCFVNNGGAVYKGIEAEGTYALGNDVFGFDLSGLSLFASGSVMSSKATNGASTGLWEPNAPKWTAAVGLLYKRDGWKFALIDKSTGPAYADAANNPVYVLPAWNNVTLTAGYSFENYELSVNVDNLLNSRAVTVITEGGTGTSPATSTDQYQFQAPISAFVTLKAHFGG